jgi:hypothetical protein
MLPSENQRKLFRPPLRLIALALSLAALSGCGWVSRHWHSGEQDQPVVETPPVVEPAPPAQAIQPAPADQPAPPESPAVQPSQPVMPSPQPPATAGARVTPAQPPHHKPDVALQLSCVDAGHLENRYTPADLYPAMAKCLAQSDYRKAVLISALAGTYTRFDTLRVADPTAHDASVSLTLQATSNVSDEQKKTFRKTQQDMIGSQTEFTALCQSIERIGPPSYFPMYMIEHGKTSSSDGDGSVLVSDFNIAKGWQAALVTYLHCAKP